MHHQNRDVIYRRGEPAAFVAAFLRAPTVDVPEPQGGEVLVEVKAATTCGTDVKTYIRGYPDLKLPKLFGHGELSGVVAEVGPKVTKFKVGQRVVAHNSAPCMECQMCISHNYMACLNWKNIREEVVKRNPLGPGAYQEYYLVPARQSAFEAADVQASDAWDYLQVFKKMTDVATQVPVSHYWALLETDLANELDLYLAGDNTLDEFLESTITLWKEYLPVTCPIITTTEPTSVTGTLTETESLTSTTTEPTSTAEPEYSPGFEWVILALIMLTIGQINTQ